MNENNKMIRNALISDIAEFLPLLERLGYKNEGAMAKLYLRKEL